MRRRRTEEEKWMGKKKERGARERNCMCMCPVFIECLCLDGGR